MTLLVSTIALWIPALILCRAQRYDGQYWPCNPMKNLTCPPNLGLDQYTYSIDFRTASTDARKDWSTSNYATITYNQKAKNGAEFTYGKRYDAPQLFTNFYIFFGRIDVEMQVAPGTGIISSSVLLSDDFDEIDWEMSGNNFNLGDKYPNGVVQNNYFSKGITGTYDRGLYIPCTRPESTFHTYSVDWTPEKLDWILDGKVVRTFLASNADKTTHQFPQTPSKIQLGLWAGGDPAANSGTRNWAGGLTNMSAAPFTMFVRNVKITNYHPAKYYNWTDQSGSWKSIKPLNISLPSPSSSTHTSTVTSVQPLRTDLPASPNGHCGAKVQAICKGSLFGECCSFYGFCGNTTEYCGLGCQSAFGQCGAQNPIATTGVTSSSSTSLKVSSSTKSSTSDIRALSPMTSMTIETITTKTSTTTTANISPLVSSSTPVRASTTTSSTVSQVPTASHDRVSESSPTSDNRLVSTISDKVLGVSTIASLTAEHAANDLATTVSHGSTPSAIPTRSSSQTTPNQQSPTAVPVDKPSWQFCFWMKQWYCYKFQSKRSYPVS
ncbi:concanavalin A-like lectin/glucanase domain-containing protein [Xylariaceae sp. FL1019]|nr:concanavalin A-like lectin/glucanase domain-containing protein [Xylariaceae sp. FL1019]